MTHAARIVRAAVVDTPIDAVQLAAEASDDRAGAVITFNGIVRNHDHGESVDVLEYLAHPVAQNIIRSIAEGFVSREGIHAISVLHRVGTIRIGEPALVAVVAGEHRGQAFECLSDLVDKVKAELPVWKKQTFTDGTHEWVGLP